MRIVTGLVTLLAVVLAASLPSCGGGSGEGGNNLLFAGIFFICSIDGLENAVVDVDANWGTGTADGAGSFAGSTTQNDDGVVTGPFDFEFPYTVDENRVSGFNGNIWQGSLNADGSVGAWSTIANNSVPQLLMVVKKSGSFDDSSLTGDYRYGYWRRDANVNTSSMGTITFDGAGAWSATIEFTNEAGLVTNGGALNGTYGVSADGVVTITFTGSGQTLQGGVKEDGEVVALGGTLATGGFPAKMVLLRAATASGDATFSGEYYVAGFAGENAGGFSSLVGLMTASGAGGISFSFSANANGTVGAALPTAGTSSVGPDGTLLVDFGPQLLGGLSAAGDLAFLAGGVNATSSPLLLFLIRK